MAQDFAEISDEGTNIAIEEAVLDSEVDVVDCNKGLARAEIDTSAPFESVKEAASRFGGIGFWKPNPLKTSSASSGGDAYLPLEHGSDTMDTIKLEEQAEKLEKDLIAKEKETLDVLKELEATKMVVEELKAKLQNETCEVGAAWTNGDPIANMDEKKDQNACGSQDSRGGDLDLCHRRPSSTPGLILMELKQAKVNLTRSTNDLAKIRATVESYKQKIEKERVSLEKTRQRLSSNSVKVLSLEKELSQTSEKLRTSWDDPMDISREIQRLSSEAEKFKKVGEAAKSEVLKAVNEIEEAKIKIKTAEMRIVAAKKMKEAAKATEAVTLADIKALSKQDDDSSETEMLTITREEYSSLMSRVHEAEEAYHRRVVDANRKVDEATVSKAEILKKVEEAKQEVKTSRKALEEALSKVDAANRCKLEVEAALRKWRSERGGQRRLSSNNSTKFKNPYRKEPPSHLFGVNDVDIVHEDMKPILKPTLSIGEILSRKLLVHGDEKTAVRKVTLGQVVGKHNCAGHGAIDDINAKQLSVKRKKFGFARISLLVAKQSKKKKKPSAAATS